MIDGRILVDGGETAFDLGWPGHAADVAVVEDAHGLVILGRICRQIGRAHV